MTNLSIGSLINRGGVVQDVEGNSYEEIYRNICDSIHLPNYVSKEEVYTALCDRERVMSTAVGHGVALPHCRSAILKNENDQQISVCYLKNPIDMNAPDIRKVSVMFVLLTSNTQTHLQVLSRLAQLFKDAKFRQLLDQKAGLCELTMAAENK
jgi:PTS system nitrogen regulatory IIA component